MSVLKESQKCPYCKETVAVGATICRYCHSEIKPAKSKRSFFARYNTFRFGFLTGVLFALVLAILVYLQFYTN
jgi:hypothetical protein